MPTGIARRRFTVEEYYRMAETGILRPADRVELIGGEVVEKMTIGPRHAACVDALARLLHVAVGERAVVRVQGPRAPAPEGYREAQRVARDGTIAPPAFPDARLSVRSLVD
jgi:hypothetical protein